MRTVAVVGIAAVLGYAAYRHTVDAVDKKVASFNPLGAIGSAVGLVLDEVKGLFPSVFGNTTGILAGSFPATFDSKGAPTKAGSQGGGFGGGGGAAF